MGTTGLPTATIILLTKLIRMENLAGPLMVPRQRAALILGPVQFSMYMCTLGGLSNYNSAVLGKYSAEMLAHTAEIAVLLGELDGAFAMTVGDNGIQQIVGTTNE